jgi:hypothetical protein
MTEFGLPLRNLIYIGTEALHRAEKVSLSFSVPVIALVAMSMLFQVDVHAD